MPVKTVAILGNATRTQNFAPFDNPHVELWAMTIHAIHAKRCTAALEMHEDVLRDTRWERLPSYGQYKKWLTETTTPIYMHEVRAEIPASVRYPRQEIEDTFGHHLWKGDREVRTFFGGTGAYGIPLAMYLGFERIELYGIELATRPEYDNERDSTFFWMGKASALGVDVVIHEKSQLVRELLYPYKDMP